MESSRFAQKLGYLLSENASVFDNTLKACMMMNIIISKK